MLEVLEPGAFTTIQDRGRPGWGHLGVPEGGAADPWSLAIANRLAGNPEGAAALEVTLAGPRLRALEPIVVALAGADLGARIPPGRSFVLAAGEELAIPEPAARGRGARAYLAVAGGLDVPEILGSRSTCLAGGFGGLDGRPLRQGDRLRARRTGAPPSPTAAWPADPIAPRVTDTDGTTVLRTLRGTHGTGSTHGTSASRVESQRWTVTPASDRMGLRLEPSVDAPPTHLTSHGVVRGAVQLPPDGRPIILMADHQPTGGYPVVAVVIAADLPALGQLAPGDAVRFEPVDLETARRALAGQRAAWAAALAGMAADEEWDELWRSAGA